LSKSLLSKSSWYLSFSTVVKTQLPVPVADGIAGIGCIAGAGGLAGAIVGGPTGTMSVGKLATKPPPKSSAAGFGGFISSFGNDEGMARLSSAL
jgi:hypothetical protein